MIITQLYGNCKYCNNRGLVSKYEEIGTGEIVYLCLNCSKKEGVKE